MPEPISGDRPIRWGIIGAGGIAETVCQDLDRSAGNVVAAVGARDAGRAAAFAARHGADRGYGDYAELAADPDVDVVYVTTTHPYHREQALLALEAGKPVLVEKPVCLNAADAREVFAAAREAGLFAMEAMWMRAHPLIRRAVELVAEGAIGEVRGVRDEFGAGLPFDPAHRMYDLANGGGALLDLGVYPATFAHLFLGTPDEVRTTGVLAPTGADETVAMEWFYAGTSRARLWCSVSTPAPDQAAVLGTEGWIAVEGGARRPTGLVVYTKGERHRIEDPTAGRGNGYGPQLAEVERCLRAGLLESPLVPQADTVAILQVLDAARAQLGVA
ncbi:MAG: Gfo/Idh/MocA family oxidoreductase, partial [Streptosporangiaceae bacterium]